MKISVDDQELFRMSEVQKKVIKNDILEKDFDEDIKGRLRWVLNHKYEKCFERLKREWEPKLKANGVKMIPTDEDEFAELVFSQLSYKNRSQREILS